MQPITKTYLLLEYFLACSHKLIGSFLHIKVLNQQAQRGGIVPDILIYVDASGVEINVFYVTIAANHVVKQYHVEPVERKNKEGI